MHRFGKFIRGKHRPIVARFLYHKDLQRVRDNSYKLKNTNFGINEQFPVVVEERRKKLYPVMKEHKRAGDKAKLVRDKNYISMVNFTFLLQISRQSLLLVQIKNIPVT